MGSRTFRAYDPAGLLMRMLSSLLPFYMFVLIHALAWNAPLLAALWLVRRRIPAVAARVAVAVGFAAATAWLLWKMEWFDVWRHGTPSLSYLTGYLPWLVAAGAIGWFVCGWVVTQRRSRTA